MTNPNTNPKAIELIADLLTAKDAEIERLREFVELVVGSFGGGRVITFSDEDMEQGRAALAERNTKDD